MGGTAVGRGRRTGCGRSAGRALALEGRRREFGGGESEDIPVCTEPREGPREVRLSIDADGTASRHDAEEGRHTMGAFRTPAKSRLCRSFAKL